MLTIRHTSAEGTLIEGTARGDGSAAVLQRQGFKWGWTACPIVASSFGVLAGLPPCPRPRIAS